MTRGQFLRGLSSGVAILGFAGAFWLGLGVGPAAFAVGKGPWAAVLVAMIAGGAGFARASARLRRRSGLSKSDWRPDLPGTRRLIVGFWIIAILELALVAVAVLLCRHYSRNDLMWPAIGVALSLHFAPLGRLFRVPVYYGTSAAGLLVSATALLAPLDESRLAWLGAGMALTMWTSALRLVLRADAMATRAVDLQPPVAN